MIKIFGINICESIENNNINSLLSFISYEKLKRVKNFRNIKVVYRSVLGEILTRYGVCLLNGCMNQEIKINFRENSKPSLIFPQNLDFNISHSGDWVVCAISDKTIGIDVELIKNANINIAKRFFTKEEFDYIVNHDEKNINEAFYRVWTLKESYLKAIGKGLTIPLNSFSINFNKEKIFVESQHNSCEKYCFKILNLGKEYIVSVCSGSNDFFDDIEVVDINYILDFFKNQIS